MPHVPPDDRRCTAIKPDGIRCGAYAVKDGNGVCAGHSSVYRDALRSGTQASIAARQERIEVRKMSVQDALAARAEQLAGKIVAAYEAGLSADDVATRVRCADILMTRVFGKPTERVETVTTDDIGGLSPQEREALRSRILDAHPELVPLRRVA